MKKKVNDIREILLKPYPELIYERTLLTSTEYFLPELRDVEEVIERNSVIGIERCKHLTECEKFAWYLSSAIHRERSENKNNISEDKRYTWSLGWCIGLAKSVFQTKSDSMCWVITSDKGLKIISPETNLILDVNAKTYSVFWIVG